jgi:hypothetical protein
MYEGNLAFEKYSHPALYGTGINCPNDGHKKPPFGGLVGLERLFLFVLCQAGFKLGIFQFELFNLFL